MSIHGTAGILMMAVCAIFALLFIVIGISTVSSLVAKRPEKDDKE
ncbi:MAG TPA: hypothetical protein VIP46_21505 [Pyrinomonadaceae bacterium]